MIPKRLVQTFRCKDVGELFQYNVDTLRARNPEWAYELHTHDQMVSFVESECDTRVSRAFKRINEPYWVGRADFFRYLYMYRHGGVYLDIKSNCKEPLDNLLLFDDEYLLSYWHLRGWGYHKELGDGPGSFQQWHVITRASHPFLKAVIEKCLQAIDSYDPMKAGVGRQGVYLTTGPIVYTLAIREILEQHPRRFVDWRNVGLEYSTIGTTTHRRAFGTHYSVLRTPVVG